MKSEQTGGSSYTLDPQSGWQGSGVNLLEHPDERLVDEASARPTGARPTASGSRRLNARQAESPESFHRGLSSLGKRTVHCGERFQTLPGSSF